MRIGILNFGLAMGIMTLTFGCGQKSDVTSGLGGELQSGTAATAQYSAISEPEGALGVGEVREQAEDGQEVTLVGVVGGSKDPFVDGLAAFTVVDPRVPYCAADEGCRTPWDYCCTQDQVKENIATIKIVDDSGSPVARSARDVLDVQELSTVVVSGKAKRDDQGNLTVAASRVYVRPGK